MTGGHLSMEAQLFARGRFTLRGVGVKLLYNWETGQTICFKE